jgi:hypothetical protein
VATMFQSAKFATLRARTDRELAAIIARQLERGLQSQVPAEAERAVREAAMLLPTIHDLPAAERSRLERQLAELCQALERASGAAFGL